MQRRWRKNVKSAGVLCTQGIKEIASLIAMRIEDIGLEAATNLINILMGNSMLQKIWISIPFWVPKFFIEASPSFL
jgi:hypothetical protein